MIKFIIFSLVIGAFILGVLSFKDEVLSVDTTKGKELIENTKEFIDEHVEIE